MHNNISKVIVNPEPNIDDILSVVNTRLFLPFTDNLLDNSIYSNTVTNTGGVALGNDGAILGIGKQLSMPFASDGDYTIELILNISNNNDYQSILVMGVGSPQFMIQKNTSVMTAGLYGGGSGGILNIDCGSYTEYFGKPTHIAFIRKNNVHSVYINGILKGTGSGTFNNNTMIYLSGYPDTNKSYGLNGTCGGFKATKKALEPSQFSMTRPMELNYTTKVGYKDYIFKGGIFKEGYSLSKISGNANFSIINNKIKISGTYGSGISYFQLNGDFTNKTIHILLNLNIFEDYSRIFLIDNTLNSGGLNTTLAQAMIDNGAKGTKNFGTTEFFLCGQLSPAYIATWSTQNTDILEIWLEDAYV